MILKETTGTSGSRYALVKEDGKLTIRMPDGEGGWYVVLDDGYDLSGDFETHVDTLDEETRILLAEGAVEFGSFGFDG